MPPLIPIIIGAALAASGVGGIILGGLTALTIGITGLGASLILGGLSRILLPQIPSISQFTIEARGRTITARQAISPWRVIYGQIRVGGVITFLHVTGATKEFLHIVITLSGHEVEEIGDMFFDGVLVPLDGSGDATGKFLNHVHVEKNLGTDTQAAFPGLLADAPTKWTANHRQLGRAGVYVRLRFNPDKFPGQLPNITFDVKGRKLYDPRTQTLIAAAPTGADRTANVVTITTTAAHGLLVGDRARVDGVTDGSFDGDFEIDTVPSATTFTYAQTAANATSGSGTAGKVAWSKNAALCFSEYLLDSDYGVGVKLPKINNPAWVAAANLSEEQVALDGGGFEDRYTCNGSFLVSERPAAIMLALLTAMGGTAVYSGGSWFIYGAAFRSPTLSFDEGDLRGPIRVQARTARRDLFNAVKGIYVSAANNWQPSDFPPVTNAGYETEDGGKRIFRDIQLPYTISSPTAQRLAKIELERARRQKTVEVRFGPTAFQAQPPDVIQLSVSRFGWASKTFEIIDERLMIEQDEDGTPRPEIMLTMRETDSTVYDWSAEESAPTAPGTPDLPDLTVAAPPTALVLSSLTETKLDIKFTFLHATWTAPADEFVTNGGMIEIQFKTNASGTWIGVEPVEGDTIRKTIAQVTHNVAYDVRIRSVNIAGARSAWVQQLNFIVLDVASPKLQNLSGSGNLASADNIDADGATFARVTLNERTGGGHGFLGLDALGDLLRNVKANRVIASSILNGAVGLDTKVADGATFKRTTANEKTGAGRGFNALNSSNRLTSGTTARTVAELEAVTKSGASTGILATIRFASANPGEEIKIDVIVGSINPVVGWNVMGTATINVPEDAASVTFQCNAGSTSGSGGITIDNPPNVGYSITVGAGPATPQVSGGSTDEITQNNPVTGSGRTLTFYEKAKAGTLLTFTNARLKAKTIQDSWSAATIT